MDIERPKIMNLSNQHHEHVAEYWKSVNDAIKCSLCPHACVLHEGETGICRARRNINRRLVSIVYGYPCAIHIDPVEKKPLYHFYPSSQTLSLSTTGCNLRCLNCQNYSISQKDFNPSEFDYVSPEEIVLLTQKNNCKSISYTYTDPVVYYEYAKDIAVIAKEKGLKSIVVSAGYINKKPLREWSKYIDAANIDLKCFIDDTYQKLSGIHLKNVLDTLEILKEEGVWLEITNLIVPDYTDDLDEIKKMCMWLVRNGFADVPLHFSKFFGTHKLSHLPQTPINKLESAYDIAKSAGLKYVYLGNIRHQNAENTYCPECNTLLIERKGYETKVINLKENKCAKCNTLIYGCFTD